jgi:hypothetical protein
MEALKNDFPVSLPNDRGFILSVTWIKRASIQGKHFAGRGALYAVPDAVMRQIAVNIQLCLSDLTRGPMSFFFICPKFPFDVL